MRKWTKTTGLLFLAAASVYSGRVVTAALEKPGHSANGAGSVRVAEVNGDAVDGVKAATTDAVAKAPATAPTTKPVEARNEGRSVSRDEVRVGDAGTVELHVNDANLVEVLRMLSLEARVNILPSKDVRGAVTANLYDVTIREALDAILKANGYAYREKGNVIYVYSAKEAKEIADSERQQQTEVFRLYYTPAVNALTMIKPVLSEKGQAAVSTPAVAGIDSGSKETGGNNHATEDMMVVTDYPENIERVRKTLKEIDRRPQQILVEATILRASLNEDNALGVDFSLLGGVNFSNITTAAGQLTGVNAGSSGSSSGSTDTGNTIPGKGGGSANSGVISGGGTGNNFTQGINGLRLGVVTNNVAVFVSALEEVTNATVLANPKVLVLNKQKGEVKVARQDPFRGKTLVNQNGLSQQEVDFLETGTLLIFRPYIGDDGYIRMEVHPEDSTPLPSRAADLPPTKLTTETTTNIMVKDGHTVVIGGMFRETAQTSRSQVPFLGNIPIAGALFRKQQDTTQREEVIILLTVHVIKDDAAYSKLSEQQMKEAEKERVGVRHGMMPWGRERLAETSYEAAVKEWNKPNPDRQKVLWHLDCATNLNANFLEAIDLRAKVTGKEVTSVDNSSIRNFVQRQILLDRAAAMAAPATTQPVTAAAKAIEPTVIVKAQPAATTKPAAPVATAEPADRFTIDDGEADRFAQYEEEMRQPGAAAAKPKALAAVPTTQPKQAAAGTPAVVITELPVDEATEAKPEKSDK